MRNFYEILGVAPEADEGDIKGAFHSLAKTFHPDVNSGSALAERRFKEIGQAYDTLKDPKTRAAYELGLVHQRKNAQRRIGVAAMTGFATSMFSTIVISIVMIWFLTDGRQVSPQQGRQISSQKDRDEPPPKKITSAPQSESPDEQVEDLARGVPLEGGDLP
jgi:DnaJ-class molecular chaperone